MLLYVEDRVDARWLEDERVVDVHYHDVTICDDASFELWRDTLVARFDAIAAEVGGKFPLIVCIDGISLATCMGDRYSELAVLVAKRYASAIARYGTRSMTGRVVAVEAMRRALSMDDPVGRAREYAANIFTNRDEAIAFIRWLEQRAAVGT